MTAPERTLVVATNHKQFQHWLRLNKLNSRDHVYVGNPLLIRGWDRRTPVVMLTPITHEMDERRWQLRADVEAQFENVTRIDT